MIVQRLITVPKSFPIPNYFFRCRIYALFASGVGDSLQRILGCEDVLDAVELLAS